MARNRRGRWVLPAALSAIALVAGLLANAAPASAEPTVAPDAQPAVVAPPHSARAVALRSGTEVFIEPPLADSANEDYQSPTGYQVVACGPYLLDSVQFTSALSDACEGGTEQHTLEVPADQLKVKIECTPNEAMWCVVLVRSRYQEQLSEPTYAGSGGVAPLPPVSIAAQRTPDGVVLTWVAGEDAQQLGSMPALGVAFEVRRNGILLADDLDSQTLTDAQCSTTDTCTYAVRAVSSAGRSVVVSVLLPIGVEQESALIPGKHERLTAVVRSNGTQVTAYGNARPSGSGSVLHVRGAMPGTDVKIPVNLAGGWAYSFSQSALGKHSLSLVEVSSRGSRRSVNAPYTVRTLRAVPAKAKAPSAPLRVSAVATGTQVTVAWQTPANNGAPITKYVVTGAPGGGTCTYTVPKFGASANSCVIKGLTYGTVYTFSVKATNSAGVSPAGVSPAVTPKSVPSAPAKPTLAAITGGVKVTWTAPASNGSPIKSYRATVSPGNATCTYTVPASAPTNTCNVTGLTGGRSYTATVVATNAIGSSLASPVSNAVALAAPATAPGAPTGVSASSATTSSLVVSWTAPSSTGGSAITDYVVEYSLQGAGSWTTFPHSASTATSITVTGLALGTAYVFRVSAKNAIGTGSASAVSSAVATLAVAPGSPTSVTAESRDGSANVSWTAPTNTGGARISSYRAVSVGDASKTCTYVVPESGTPANACVVTGLTNGNSYKFTVVAINAAGESGASLESSAIYAGATAAVTSVIATPGNAQATVTFPNIETLPAGMGNTAYLVTVDGHPDMTGCTAYRGYVYTPVFAVAPEASCSVYGLTNGVEYSFSVQVRVSSLFLPDPNIRALSPLTRSNSVTPSAPPSAPRSVTVYSFNGGALLSWDAPSDNGGSPITAYRVTATPSAGDPITYGYGPSARKVGINGLDHDVSYSMSVTAVTERGTGTAVASSAAFFTAKTSAPRNISVVGGDGQAVVTWDEPSSIPFPVLSYTITATDYYYPSQQVTFSAAESPATFTGLTNGHTYTFAVVAENGAGFSPTSASSAATLVAALPDAPSSASVDSGNRFVTVTWAPVDFERSGGSNVSEYVITATPSSGDVITKTVVGSYTWDWSSLQYSVSALDGLADGVDYTFTVAAKNAMGLSSATNAGTTHSIGAPTPVVITSTVAANSRVTVTWNAPASDGGSAVTQYTVSASWSSCVVFPSGPGPYSCTVYGLSNGSNYGFMVTAQNGAGSSYSNTWWASPHTSAPDSPSNVGASASAVTQGAVTVTWDVPTDNGGSTITSYTVTSSPGGRTCYAYSSNATTCTVYGLTPGLLYTFTVTATNVLGTSAPSATSNSATAKGRPGQPDVPVVRGGPSTATVTFTPPSDGGLAITRYEISVIDMNPLISNPPAVYGTQSPVTVTGLILGHTYRFAVTARNAMGDGYMSGMTDDWISANKPSAPNITSVTPGTDSVHVVFTTPANGGSPITSYELVAVDDTEPVADTIVRVASSPAQIPGLVTGHSYRVTARATNVAGDSPASVVSSSVVPQAAPGAPSGVTATSTDGGLSVAFTPPTVTGGSAVTGYRVRAHDSVTGADTYATGSNSPISIAGLVNGREYVVSAQATKGAYIAGPFADGAGVGVPAGVPGAPMNVIAANSQNAQSSVSFSAPTGNGSPITSYTVTAVDQAAPFTVITATGPSSPIVITGLTNRHYYRISVAATNRMGTGDATANVGYTVPVAPPGAPTIGVVSATSSTSATVPFTAPVDNGGSAVISYTVTATDRDDAAGTRTVVGYASPISVTSLIAGDTYSFAITATNVSSTGVPSADVPVAPQGVTGVLATAGNSQAEIEWVVPSPIFGEPATYTAETNTGESCTSSGSTCVISGLTNYVTYTVTVSAQNVSGRSSSTAPVSVTPIPVSIATTVPSAPRNVVANPHISGFNDGSATVTWDAPTNSGGGAITGYVVTTSPVDGTCVTQFARTCVLTGLDPYALYTVRVVATNSVGSSVAGTSSEVSACGFDTRLARCKWKVAGQDARAEQVDGGVRVSWRYGSASTATAMPSGRTCTSLSFDPVTLQVARRDSQDRQYCVITGAFDSAETFRVNASEFDSSSSVHATWVSLTAPSYTRQASPHVSGTLTSGSSVTIVAAPVSCSDPLSCDSAITYSGDVTGGAFDVPLTAIAEGVYNVYVSNPLLQSVLARTTPQVVVVDRTDPTPLTVPVGTSVVVSDNTTTALLGVDFTKTAIVSGLAECDAVNTFTVTWFSGDSATGSALRTHSPVRTPLGSVCWYSDTLPGAADGTYTVVVTLTDPSGNSSTVSENVIVDSAAPNLSVDVPLAGETVPSGIIGVSGASVTASTDASNLTVTAVRGDDVVARAVDVATNNSWSTELALTAGSWSLTVERSDRAGNTSSVTRSITVVDSPTTLSITQPVANSIVGATTTVRGWAIPGSHVVVTSGATELGEVTADADGSWSVQVSLDPSTTGIKASVGVADVIVPISVGVAPTSVTIANPGVGGRTNGRPLTGTAPIGASVTVTIDSASTGVVVDANGQWFLPLTGYVVGSHTVSATDGNTTANQTIVIDRAAPIVSITTPVSASIRTSSVVVSTPSSISDAASVQMSYFIGLDTTVAPQYVANVPVTGSEAIGAFPSALADAVWTLVVTRSDAAGNVGRSQVSFTYDRQAPIVTSNVASSMKGPLTVEGVAGTAVGDRSLTVTIDGAVWTAPTSGAFSHVAAPAITSGIHTVVLRQIDDAGNETVRTTTVTVDSVAPNLTMNLDGTGATFAGLSVSGSATGDDGRIDIAATQCALGASPCAADETTRNFYADPVDGAYSQSLPLTNGYWYVTTRRIDFAGNITTRAQLVLVNIAAPELSIVTPFSSLSSGVLAVTGATSSDEWRNPKVRVSITRVGAISAAFQAEVTVVDGAYAVTSSNLADGVYDVVVTRDDLVHPASTSRRVTIDTSGPELLLDVLPNDRVRTYCVSAGVTSTDLAQVSFRLALASATYAYTQNVMVSAGRACVIPPSEGVWDISATQADSLGNDTVTATVSVPFDFTAPVVFVNNPAPDIGNTARWASVITGTAGVDSQDASRVRVNISRQSCVSDCSRQLLADVTPDGTWSADLADVPAGSWRVTTVTQSDAAGNVGTFSSQGFYSLTYSFTVDHTAPSAPTLSGSGVLGRVSMQACASTNVVPLSLVINVYRSGSDEPFRSMNYSALNSYWCTGPRDVVVRNWLIGADRFPNGNYTVIAEMRDPLGHVARSSSLSYVSNWVTPVVAINQITAADDPTSVSTATFGKPLTVSGTGTYNDFDPRTVTLTFAALSGDQGYRDSLSSSTFLATMPLAVDGTWSTVLPANLPVGAYRVTATQGAGSATSTFTVALPAPVVTLATVTGERNPGSSNPASTQTITVTGTLPVSEIAPLSILGTDVTITSFPSQLAASAVKTCTPVVSGGNWTCTLVGAYPNGSYTFTAATRLAVAYTKCTAISNAGVCTTQDGAGIQRVSGSGTFTLNGEVPYPSAYINMESAGRWDTYSSTSVQVAGLRSTRTGDLRDLTLSLYRRSDIAAWPTIVESPYSTFTVNAWAADGRWTKEIYVPEGRWVIRVSQANNGGLVGYSTPREFTIDTSPPTIEISNPSNGEVIPSGRLVGTISGGYGIKAGSADTSNLAYAQDGSVTYYQGWNGTSGAQGGFEWISTNRSRTWAARNNNVFTSAVTLAQGKWTAVIEASDENGRRATRAVEFEIKPNLLPARPVITARLDGSTPIVGAVLTDTGYHRITVRVEEKYGWGLSQAPQGAVRLMLGATVYEGWLINREATFLVPISTGSSSLRVGFDGSPDNSAVDVGFNFLNGWLEASSRPAQNLTATFSYPAGAGVPGVATVAANFVGADSTGRSATLPCLRSIATVTDSAGKVLGSGTLANGGRFALAATASGSQDLTVQVAEGSECSATSGTFPVTLAQTPTPVVTASVASSPVPYVAGDAVINANLAVTSVAPLAVGVPVLVEDSLGTMVSTAVVLTDASGNAVLHVTPATAGNKNLTVVAGGGRSGFQRTTAPITVSVEPSAVSMILTVDSAGTRPGEAATATLTVGGPGSLGTVAFGTGQTPGPDAEIVNPSIVCSTDCRATGRFPNDVRDAGVGETLRATYTSAATGRVFTQTVATGRVRWTSSISDVEIGAGPPISLTAVSGGSGTVNLAWIAPPTVGNTTIIGYQVNASIGGLSVGQCTTTSTSCAISGLPNETAVRFTAVTRTSAGDSGAVTATAAASGQVNQTPVPVSPSQALHDSVLRDHLVPVSTKILFPSSMASKFRTGTVTFHAVQNVFCGRTGVGSSRVNTYCTPTRHDVTVDLSTGATTDTLVITNVNRSAIDEQSLAAAGVTIDLLTPKSSINVATEAGGIAVTVTSQVFVGAYEIGVTADYAPGSATGVATARTANAAGVHGAGAPVIRMDIASANITGGKYAPVNNSLHREGTERVLSWSNWGVRDPRVGETAFVRATIDPVFGVDDDAYVPMALAVSQPGTKPLFVAPDSSWSNDRLYSAAEMYGSERQTINAASIPFGGQEQWRSAVAGTGLTCLARCIVWAIRNIDSADPVDFGGLTVGTNDIGIMSYADSGQGLVSTTLNVSPWATTQTAEAALTSEAAGQKLRVMTAARWTGMAPEVQTSMANVMVSLQLTHAGDSRIIAICFYSGVCLGSDGNGTTFLKPDITPIGGRMAMEIDPSSLGFTLTSADSLIVTTTTPWGIPAASSSLPLNATSVAVNTTGSATVSASGQWLGGVLQEPSPIHSSWWWAANSAMDWFRNAQHSLWMAIFRSEAVTSFLMAVTAVGLSMIPIYNIFSAMTCSTWTCAALAIGSMVAGPVFAGLKAGFVAFKAARAAAIAARPATAAASAPGRVARFLTAAKSRATAAAMRVTTTMPVQVARQMAWAVQFRIGKINQGWLYFGKIMAQTAQAEIIKSVVPGRASFDEIVSGYLEEAINEYATSGPANDPAFREVPEYTLLVGDQMVAADDTVEGQRVVAWNQAIADAYAGVAAANPPQPIDIGYGVGVSMQFAQQFSSQVSIALPNLSNINLSASKVQAMIMPSAYDAAADNLLHARSPSAGEATGYATLGTCSFDGSCATLDGITATVFRGSLEISGVFPQSVSWFPRGAWIKYLVTVVSNSGAITTYRAAANIPFPGRVATDIEAGEAGAITMAYVRPHGTDPVGPYTPWPTGAFDPKTDYPADTAILTGGP